MSLLYCQGADWRPRTTLAQPGTCGSCGVALVGRNHWFCPEKAADRQAGTSCRSLYMRNHDWGMARMAAIKRDGGKCVRCGKQDSPGPSGRYRRDSGLEVNHIEPRNGAGYTMGCWNHLDGLESLCHPCHLAVTASQRAAKPRPVRRDKWREKLAQWNQQVGTWDQVGAGERHAVG